MPGRSKAPSTSVGCSVGEMPVFLGEGLDNDNQRQPEVKKNLFPGRGRYDTSQQVRFESYLSIAP